MPRWRHDQTTSIETSDVQVSKLTNLTDVVVIHDENQVRHTVIEVIDSVLTVVNTTTSRAISTIDRPQSPDADVLGEWILAIQLCRTID